MHNIYESPLYPAIVALGILLGHLFGDYIVQNDWQAKNKTNPHPGPEPLPENRGLSPEEVTEHSRKWLTYEADLYNYRLGHLACFVHCWWYTIAVWAGTFLWMPWWGLVACFVLHYPVDRFRLAAWWMKKVSGQEAFATGPLSPWSIILVDNIFHLLTLYGILVAAVLLGR